MKKLCVVFICVCLAFTGCANSFNNEDEEKELEYKTFTGGKSYSGGFLNFINKDDTKKNTLIKNSELSDFEDINFIMDYIEDDRFISCDEYYGAEADGADRSPRGSFLTYPDGTKEKICTDAACRNDPDAYCTHVNLVGGIVDGNYVYYMGKFNNGRIENELTGSSLDYSNYLMRYNLVENVNEVIMELPWYASIVYSAYGCLYINVDQLMPGAETVNSRARTTVIYDKEQCIAAGIGFDCTWMYYSSVMGEWLYYIAGSSFKRTKYDLSETEIIDNSNNEYVYYDDIKRLNEQGFVVSFGARTLGAAKNRVFFTRLKLENMCYDIMNVDDKNKIREVITDVNGAVLSDGYLYCIHGEEVYRYTLEYRGRISGEGEVVFREEDSCKPNEHIKNIEAYGDTITVTTIFNSGDVSRTFIITDYGAVLDSEGDV